MSPHTDPGALLKLADDLENFGHCWCLEERRRATIIAALRQAASPGRAGGEAVASPQEVQEACARVADRTALRCIREQIPGDATANFIAKAIRALIPPVKTGGEAEMNTDVAQINMDRAPAADEATGDAGSNPVVSALPKLTALGEDELYGVRDIIASHISCEGDCQKRPNGCGCALTAAREIVEGRAIAQEAGNCGDIEQLRASNDQRGNDLVTVIAQRDAAETALRAVVRDLVSISERYRAIALPSAQSHSPAARVPKVRTSHHRNKEEAERLQALVDKRYIWPAGCHDPDSCARHFGCMYIQCPNMKKDGNDLAAEIRASVISSTGRESPTASSPGGSAPSQRPPE